MKEQQRARARELGIAPGRLSPGPLDAITDVAGVQVGQVTLMNGLARTGVTAILPHPGNIYEEKVPSAVHAINGYGKATGFEQVRELGVIETPIVLTNTLSVGCAWDALVTWTLQKNAPNPVPSLNPMVGECNDGWLNDIQGRHIREEHVLSALSQASGGVVAEGAVGAGTGMTCYEFKGGVGTASRRAGKYTLGVLLVSNFGSREQLVVDGVPVGRELRDWKGSPREQDGSVMVVIATDAPLSDRQLGRVARRTGMGLARTGSTVGHSSGDFAIAFSTAYRVPNRPERKIISYEFLSENEMNPLFQAAVEAVEEAVLNSLFRAQTLEGLNRHISYALPVEETLAIMRRYGRLQSNTLGQGE